MGDAPIAVYVHVPFCPSKCGYCDFNSYAMQGDIVERTVRATVDEIRQSPYAGRPAKTIFFGGGTPTFLSPEQLSRILEAVLEAHPPIPDCEITSEANPGTVDALKFRAMFRMGFNRISLGAQSFQAEDLVRLGRVHTSGEAGRALSAAREAGFANINMDLMFALPGQSLAAWQKNLDLLSVLKPDHISLYCLTIEPNTRYYKLHLRGMLDLPEEGLQVAMYDAALDWAKEQGYQQYEISNFCRPGLECRHNMAYWRCEEYAGYGPGAVGRVGDIRYTVMKHPQRYCDAVESGGRHEWGSPLWCEQERLNSDTDRMERIMMGLRLREGLDPSHLELPNNELVKLETKGWVVRESERVRLTDAGLHFCSEVALALC